MKMQFEKSKLGLTAVTIIGGIIVSMLSGFFENAAKGSMIAAFVFYPIISFPYLNLIYLKMLAHINPTSGRARISPASIPANTPLFCF
jgi:hypothetical protein